MITYYLYGLSMLKLTDILNQKKKMNETSCRYVNGFLKNEKKEIDSKQNFLK